MNRFRILALCAGLGLMSFLSIGCPYDGPHYPTTYGVPTATPTQAPLTASITISGSAYSPTAVTIFHGGTVSWINTDAWAHTVLPDNGSGVCAANNPLNPSPGPGNTVTLPFNNAGNFNFHCSIHNVACGAATCTTACSSSPMYGTVVVQ
jgi:plastocyanin